MSIVKMKHLRLLGLTSHRSDLLKGLQALGCVEITEPVGEGAQWDFLTQQEDGTLPQLKVNADLLATGLKALQKVEPAKGGLLTPRREVAEADLFCDTLQQEAIAAATAIQEAQKQIQALMAQQSKLHLQQTALHPWLELDVDLSYQGTSTTTATFGALPPAVVLTELTTALELATPLVEVIPAGRDKEFQYVLLLCHKSAQDQVMEALKPFAFSRLALHSWQGTAQANCHKIDAQLQKVTDDLDVCQSTIAAQLPHRQAMEVCADRLTQDIQRATYQGRLLESDATFVMEGWYPAPEEDALKALLNQYPTAFESRDPQPEEYPQVPTKLQNNALTQPLNMVTEMYALPAYDGIDPNPMMAPFFITFYGIMMADMGYGLIMMLAALVVLKKGKPPAGGMRNLLSLMGLCGVTTFIVGALTGSFFGDFIPQLLKIIDPTSTFALPYLFTPLTNTMDFLIASLVIGAIQTITGMVISVVKQGKDGNIREAFFNEITWWIILGGLGLMIAGLGPWVMAAGFVILAVGQFMTKGLLGGLAGLLGAVYNGVTGFFSDILSYSRLMALMLAGSIIAQVFNTLGAVTGNVIGFVIIAFLGNALNFALNILGCYVHDLRLQCLEFFGRFYKDGGKPFRPLNIQTKYVSIIKEEQ